MADLQSNIVSSLMSIKIVIVILQSVKSQQGAESVFSATEFSVLIILLLLLLLIIIIIIINFYYAALFKTKLQSALHR